MRNEKPEFIDPILFDLHFEAFRAFVEDHSGVKFISFSANPYTEKQEGYKYKIYSEAREKLAFYAWNKEDIGSGLLVKAAIAAIEIPNNNLLHWQGKFGPGTGLHQPLYSAQGQPHKLVAIEQSLYNLYHTQQDEQSFDILIDIFGKNYPIVAYLFFLKDRSQYLPIAPLTFDRAFEYLGVNFITSHHCSWVNYTNYIGIIGELKELLFEKMKVEATLLDAHSFAWILASQMEKENRLADTQEYMNLPTSEREAIVKARRGQGRFRKYLIKYWDGCAVTGCREESLLIASHIKPWKHSSLKEKIYPYNGLLLTPSLDAAFDGGYISFDNEGSILISERLTSVDADALAIHAEMRLRRIEPEHREYLEYHRKQIFK